MGVFISCLAEYTTATKKKIERETERRQEREMKDRHAEIQLGTSKQKRLNDLEIERECRI